LPLADHPTAHPPPGVGDLRLLEATQWSADVREARWVGFVFVKHRVVRVVSLLPATTEIPFALGASARSRASG
jgi:hypothetical protein